MMPTDAEEFAFMLFRDKLKDHCKKRYLQYDPEDRFSEASYAFLCALRCFPTDSGHFWETYLSALPEHMNKNKPSDSYKLKHMYLDAPIFINGESTDLTRNDLIEAPLPDPTSELVWAFWQQLTHDQQTLIQYRMENLSDRTICKKMGYTKRQLQSNLAEIGSQYQLFRTSHTD